jgi:hypothetical protein
MAVPIKIFTSTQTSAPQLSGQAGKLNDILYACLCTGYNSKTVSSISVANNIATAVTSTDHNYAINDIIKITDANESVFNDDFTITEITNSTTFKFDITTNIASATGTMTSVIAPLGWAREYTGTNKAVYRSTQVDGTRLFLRIDDTNAKYANAYQYEDMTSVDIGVNAGQTIFWSKSTAADVTARNWWLVGDSKFFYFFPQFSTTITSVSLYGFGELSNPFYANDSWHSVIFGSYLDGSSQTPSYATDMYICFSGGQAIATSGTNIARSSVQIGSYVYFYLASLPYHPNALGFAGSYNPTYPSPTNFSLNLFKTYVKEGAPNYSLRGILPGFYVSYEGMAAGAAFANGNRTIVQNGITYAAFRTNYSTNIGNFFIDITGPWY